MPILQGVTHARILGTRAPGHWEGAPGLPRRCERLARQTDKDVQRGSIDAPPTVGRPPPPAAGHPAGLRVRRESARQGPGSRQAGRGVPRLCRGGRIAHRTRRSQGLGRGGAGSVAGARGGVADPRLHIAPQIFVSDLEGGPRGTITITLIRVTRPTKTYQHLPRLPTTL